MFSQTSGGYQQYTTDHSETFLKDLCEKCSTSDQIAIHRNGNLAYYAYAHKNSDSEIYGICIVCGEVCLNLKGLYDFLKKAIDESARKGVLFRYNESGEITKNVETFFTQTAEVDNLFCEIKEYLDKRPSYWEKLPSEDFSIPLSAKITFSFEEDSKDKITDAIRHYHNIVVTMKNATPTSYARTVERLNKEKELLADENNGLKEDIESLHREKKQYRWVALLSLAVIASLVGLYFLNDNLSGVISDQGNTITRMSNTINDRDTHIALLQDTLTNERNTIESQKTEIRVLNSNILSYQDSLKASLSYNEELQSSLSYCQSELSSSRKELTSCQTSLRKAENNFSAFKKKFPIDITDIEIANTYQNGNIETNYGYTIYSRNTMFLRPRIKYTGINSGQTIILKVKWYTPNGSLSRGDSSPNGFSQSESLYVYSGSNTTMLISWGNKNKGYWGKGTYRIEIWYEDVCLRAENFTIY